MWNVREYDNNNNVIYELKNGKGFIKEYNEYNTIRYEGMYLNGERNGKSKLYSYSGKLIFEAEYINGIINRKGKEYNDKGEVIYEGDYLYFCRLNGKSYIHGRLEYEGEYLFHKKWNGKGYDENGNIIYELTKGNGKIIEYNMQGGLIFEGEYLNGRKNGKIKDYNFNGILIFKGKYLNGKKMEEEKNIIQMAN